MFTHPFDIDILLMPFFNGNCSPFLDGMAMALTTTIAWLPLFIMLFYIVIKNNESMQQIGLIILATVTCLAVTASICDGIVKPSVCRLRPINDPEIAPMLHIIPGIWAKTYSFFSGHAANTCGIAVFFALLIRNIRFTTMMLSWSLINCWTRMYLGLHFPSDIVFGLLCGIIVGCMIYFLYSQIDKRIHHKSRLISTQYSSTGYFVPDINMVISVFLMVIFATILYTLLTL